MARSRDIQYVQFYTGGSAARQIEFPEKKKPQPKPKQQRQKLRTVALDPVAAVGTVVALVMLVCMIVGFVQVCNANTQLELLQAQVVQLEAENTYLERQYANGYDLNEIRLAAESMGLVPVEEVEHITISLPEPEVVEQTSWWENLLLELKALFA